MKNLVLVLIAVIFTTSLIGCGKKESTDISMEGLNGVATENVVSVTDPMSTEAVPVIVDNAPVVENALGEMAVIDQTVAISNEKPTNKNIQQALKNAGLYSGKVDGSIGPKTKSAIEAFQSQNGLKADGKVGPKTWKALSSYLNRPAEVSNPSADSQYVGE